MLHTILSHGLQPQRHPSGTYPKVIFILYLEPIQTQSFLQKEKAIPNTQKIHRSIITDLKLQLFPDEFINNKEDSASDV